ncbi:MAG TPA: P-II family nitrogen regulator [bacterium]|jgi:nitrogen regulatory protein PII|nr:P-II family nitrogen regulator [bacterium]
MGIKRIEAIIRPERLEPLRVQLEAVGYPGMTVSETEGHGKQRGVENSFRGNIYKTYFIPKVKVVLTVSEKSVKAIVDTIIEVCKTGKPGDGKIFITDVAEVIRIRTEEKGLDAL